MQPRMKQMAQDGATDGQVPKWNNATGKWEPGTVSGGGSITGLLTKAIPFTDDIPSVTPPTPSTTGTDIDTLDFPDGSTTGQKVEFDVPDDYDGGDLEVLAVWRPESSVAGPTNVRIQTDGEIGDISDGDVDTISSANTDVTVPDSSTAVERTVLKTITSGTFGAGDHILLNFKRLGADGSDTYTADWKLIGMQYRYTGQVQTRAATQSAELFSDTDETPPSNGTLGTDINTLDFAVDEEQKTTFLVPDNWDEISDAYIRVVYGMSTAEASKTVTVETAGEIANVDGGTVDTLGVVSFDIDPANDSDVPHRTVAIRVIPASALHKGDQVTLKFARRTSTGSEHSGDFQLVTMTLTLGVAPSSGVTAATIWAEYLTFMGFQNQSGSIGGDYYGLDMLIGGGSDEEAYFKISSTAASGVLQAVFAGRFGPSQTAIKKVKVPLKGAGASPYYRWRLYCSGYGSTAQYDSGSQAAPGSLTTLEINDTQISNQPDSNGKFWVVVEAQLDASEDLYLGPVWAQQE